MVELLVSGATPPKKHVLLARGIRFDLNFANTVRMLKEDITTFKKKSSHHNCHIPVPLGQSLWWQAWPEDDCRGGNEVREGCRQKEATETSSGSND